MSERFLSHPSVRHVASCLEASGHRHGVIALDDTARSAEEAAAALGVDEALLREAPHMGLLETTHRIASKANGALLRGGAMKEQ